MGDLQARVVKSQCAAAAAAGNLITEDILRDIYHDSKFWVKGIMFYMRVQAASLHEIILCRNRSTSPGPTTAPADAIQFEGVFFEYATYTIGEFNVYFEFPGDGISFDKDDSLNLRFDWGAQGAGEKATFEVTILYTPDKP